VAELVKISGAVGIAAGLYDREDLGIPVRIVIDGHLNGYGLKNTAHKGTEETFTIQAEAGLILQGSDAKQFDDAIAEARAKNGEDDPRQGTLDDADDDGNVHNLPLGNEEATE